MLVRPSGMLSLCLSIFALVPFSFAVAQDRPNIVFLFADDQRADTIGAWGNDHIDTPNLDRLVAEGYSFRRNYCAGSFSGAVCVASRAMLMTGRQWKRLPDKNPAKDWQDFPLLTEVLANEGNYQSFIVGKWHNGEENLLRAFQDGESVFLGGMADHTKVPIQDLRGGKLGAKRTAAKFSSEQFADSAIKFINEAQSDQPYFLYVAFTAPHDPRNPPLADRERYYAKRPPLPQNFMPQHPFNNMPQTVNGRDESLAPWPRTPEMIGDQLCEYYGLVSHLDRQVGRILHAIDSGPQKENTIVIYTADHGLAMGSHGLLGKQNVYEHSMRCPLIFRGPGIPQGMGTERLTYLHDCFATVCTLADCAIPASVDSKDLSALWEDSSHTIHDYVVLPFQDVQRAITDGKWKLHIYPKVNHQLLFNLAADPHELSDLSSNTPEETERLRLWLENWRKEFGDEDPLDSDSPEPLEPQYDNSKRREDRWQPDWIKEKYFRK